MLKRLNIDPIRTALVTVLALGIAFRLAHLLHGRSLWVDEAMLALNVFTRSWGELIGGLDLLQAAPLLYLWIERVMFLLGGTSEIALRLPIWLSGIALLALAIPLTERLVDRSAVLPVAAALSLSTTLILYGNEAKPYGSDAFVAVLVIWVASRALDTREVGSPLLAATLFFAPLASLPATFVGAGVIATLGLLALRREMAWKWVAGYGGAWLLGSLAAVLVSRDPEIVSNMQAFWFGTFLTLDAAGASRLWNWLVGLANDVGWGGPSQQSGAAIKVVALLAFTVVGAARLVRAGRGTSVLLLTMPLAAGAGASVVGLYPVYQRLWLWAIPIVTVLASAALFSPQADEERTTRSRLWRTGVALALVVVMMGTRGRYSFYLSHSPADNEHARPTVERLLAEREAGEPVYVIARAAPAWHVYATDWSSDLSRTREAMRLASPGGPAYINDTIMSPITPEEESALTWVDDAVLLGRSSGLHLSLGGPGRPVDPEWAPYEVARLRRYANPCGWFFLAHVILPEWDALLAEVERVGGVEGSVYPSPGADARRVCFPAS